MKRFTLTTAQTAALMVLFTLCSKVLGFIRETVQAYFFGTGMAADAYLMAVNIPGSLLSVILAPIGAVYILVFSQKREKEGEAAGDLFVSQLLNNVYAFVLVAMVLGILFSKPLVSLFAPGYEGDIADLTAFYLRFAFLMLTALPMSFVFESYLQYNRHFISPITLNYIQNICIILGIVISAKSDYHFLILGPLAGEILSAVFLRIRAGKIGFIYSRSFERSGWIAELSSLVTPVFLGGIVSQTSSFTERILASRLPEGSVSSLYYGKSLIGVFSTLTISVLVTIVYPELNKAFAMNDYQRVSSLTGRGMDLIMIVSVPFTLGGLVFAHPVIQTIFERGKFDSTSTRLAAAAFFFYLLGVVFTSVNTLLDKVFYSLHNTKAAVACSAFSAVFNIVLNVALINPMGHTGLALAASVSQAFYTLLLYCICRKKYPQIVLLKSKRKLGLVCVFSLISVGAAYCIYNAINSAIRMPAIVSLGIVIAAAVLLYLLFLILFKFEEVNLLKDLFLRKGQVK